MKSAYNPFQVGMMSLAFILFLLAGLSVLQKNAGGIFLLAAAFYFLVIFFRRAPIVTLSEDYIRAAYPFGSLSKSWQEVEKVELNRKASYTVFFIPQPIEAAIIYFKDGKKLILFNDMYSNLPRLKRFISERTDIPGEHVVKPVHNVSFGKEIYAGNPYTSFNSLMIVGMLLFFYFTIPNWNEKAARIILIFFSIMYLFWGWQMNYFIIDNDMLVIRNHYLPWKKKMYPLTDITEAAIETPYRRSTALRIITTDQESRLYSAGSLRERHWKKLAEDLHALGIPVRRGY